MELILGILATLAIISGVVLAFFSTLGNSIGTLLLSGLIYAGGFTIICYVGFDIELAWSIIISMAVTIVSWIYFWKHLNR